MALLAEINEIFVSAEMGEEGAKLVETSRKETMEIMNRGVMLVSKGQYKEAIDAMRSVREAMLSNVRVLLNLVPIFKKSSRLQSLWKRLAIVFWRLIHCRQEKLVLRV